MHAIHPAATVHSSRVRPNEFLAALFASRGTTPTAFLRANGMGKLQPTLSRFLGGHTASPRAKWVARVADALGVAPEAFWLERAADAEALRLNIDAARAPVPISRAPRSRQARIDPGHLAHQLANLMRGYDQDMREAAAPLVRIAMTQPDRADEMAAKLRQLLADDRPQAETLAA